MAFCMSCGKELPDGAKFCCNCGAAVTQQTDNTNKRTSYYDGEIHKCPSCGEVLHSFEHKCKACGYELRNANTSNVVKEFAEKIEKTKSKAKKIELISNFYIPNTREDIYEFFILALSNVETNDYCVDAWQAKLEQAYHKAKLSFGKTSEFGYINSLYQKSLKIKNARKFNNTFSRLWKFILGGILILVAGFMFIYGTFKGSESGDPNSPYHAMACIGFFPGMGGFWLFFMALTSKKKSVDEIEEEEVREEVEEEPEEQEESIKEKLKKKINKILK